MYDVRTLLDYIYLTLDNENMRHNTDQKGIVVLFVGLMLALMLGVGTFLLAKSNRVHLLTDGAASTPIAIMHVNVSSTPRPSNSTFPSMSVLPGSKKYSCLIGYSTDDIVSAEFSGNRVTKVTIGQKLNMLGASCNTANQLIDNTGKRITFFPLTGCWGMPPQNYLEILSEQDKKIKDLSGMYTVITLTCNSSGFPMP